MRTHSDCNFRYRKVFQETKIDYSTYLLAILFSFIAAYLCIYWFIKLIDRIGMLPFVIYRLLLGVILIGYVVTLA